MTERRERAPFLRGRHLALALIASAFAVWFIGLGPAPAQWLLSGDGWTPQMATLNTSLLLFGVAVPAWLAVAVIDTHSGVTVWPSRWRSLGVAPLVMLGAMIASSIYLRCTGSDDQLQQIAMNSYGVFLLPSGTAWGWYFLRLFIGVLVEEVLYRVLIQRAIEGYVSERDALIYQAVLFQFAHAVIYGYGFSLYHGFGGLTYGLAFMRTRSLAAPMLIHMLANLAHALMFMRVIPI